MTARRWLASTTLVLALSGCNGSGNSGSFLEVPFPQDDQFTAATATVQTLDVLANDVDSGNGPLTIIAVEGTGQVLLSVQGGNRIQYQPACCAITTDQFTYTVENREGRRATATVQVDVQRRIQLTLRAPALASIATAMVAVGTTPVPVTVSGNTVTANIDFRTDDLLVRAEFGQSARLALVSALGSVPELVGRTPASGRLDASAWAALEVSPFTTSLAGTVAAGELPTFAFDFDAQLAALSDWEGVARRANYLASVLAAGESALPSDGTTLYQLASTPFRVEDLLAETTLAAGPRPALFPASAAGALAAGAGTYWFYRGGSQVDEGAFKLELSPGGSGTLVGPRGAIPVAWNGQQNAVNVAPAGPAGDPPTLLTTGLITRRGGACEFNLPKLFERVDRVSIKSLRLASLAYSAPSASVAPHAWIASVTGTKVKGFSLSGCQPLFDDADAGPSFPFEIRSGPLLPAAALALSAGRWVLPFFADAADGRPLPQAAVEVSANGSGVGPDALAFTSQPQPDGSLVLTYPGVGTLRLYAINSFGSPAFGRFRVLVESQRTSGERRVDEAWAVRNFDTSNFAARLRDVRLLGCCRQAALRTLRFDAQGQAFWELTSGGLAPAVVDVELPRGVLTVQVNEDALVIEPIGAFLALRVLTYSHRVGESTGGVEVVSLQPLAIVP